MRFPRLSMEQLPPELAAVLRPRVERLGYLGEFFQCAAQQPKALRTFMQLTDDLKEALPDDLTEAVALTVACLYRNDYERHQHERLCRKLGFADDWIRAVEELAPESAALLQSPQRAAQRLTLAVLGHRGRGVESIFATLVEEIGPPQAMAVLMLIGRYVTHSLVVNTLGLEPPVPSPLPDPPTRRREPLWISEVEVAAVLSLDDAIAALEQGLRREARGEAVALEKTHASWDANTLHAIGAVFPAEGFAGTKTWAHTRGGAQPVFALFDSNRGELLALIEAFTLGQLRTGGISAVATRWLAAAEADELAIIGSGKQAAMQVRAVAAVRPLRRVRVFSPTAEHRAAFAARLRTERTGEVVECQSVEEAIAGAAIVTLCTRAKTPFTASPMLARGAHINAVGAITLERAEIESDVLERCSIVAADSVASAKALSRELRQHFEPRGWDGLQPLSTVVAAGRPRPIDADLTLFKAMGMGLSDLSLAVEIYGRVLARGLGRRI